MKFKLESLSQSSGWSVDEVCKKCAENSSECRCNTAKEILGPEKHQLHFRFEKRNGKPVTIVCPFFVSDEKLKEILTKLKKTLGVGGAIKENEIELQGDLKEKARANLEKIGFRFKK